MAHQARQPVADRRASLATVAREWTRIGVIGFGGPPAHVALLRELVVERNGWMDAHEFEDANAACGLLPGPASTQLSILCAFRVAGPAGALVGGLGFVLPAIALILALSPLFLGGSPPTWIRGASAGAGAVVAAVALQAARSLLGPSLARVRGEQGPARRWALYLAVGTAVSVFAGSYLVLALLACGAAELLSRRRHARGRGGVGGLQLAPLAGSASMGGMGALAWTALKVGALSFGGGFVIVPLMQSDAVDVYHWMTSAQFLTAVALGQVTPGPVVATVAAVGYAAHGLPGGVMAAAVAFSPSFAFVLAAGRHYEQLRTNDTARAFLAGAGPAAIGAIVGAAITLAVALREGWQFALLALAAVAILVLGRSFVLVIIGAGVAGALLALAGAPLP